MAGVALAWAASVGAALVGAPPAPAKGIDPAAGAALPVVVLGSARLAIDPQGGATRELPRSELTATPSPDGRFAWFLGSQSGEGRLSLQVARVQRRPGEAPQLLEARRVVSGAERPRMMAWAPTGATLYCVVGPERERTVLIVDAERPEAAPRTLTGRAAPIRLLAPGPGGVLALLREHPDASPAPHGPWRGELVLLDGPAEGDSAGHWRERVLAEVEAVAVAWRPDGAMIATAEPGAVVLRPVATESSPAGEPAAAQRIPLGELDPDLAGRLPRHLAWRPDGKALLFALGWTGTDLDAPEALRRAAWILDPSVPALHRLETTSPVFGVGWTADANP